MRSLSNIVTYKKFHKFALCERRYLTKALENLLKQPDKILMHSKEPVFKCSDNDTTTVAVVEVDGHKFVMKRYNIKGFRHWLKKFWRKSRAMHAWQHAHYLQALHIPTLTPVAVIEKRFGILRGTSYFIYEYIEGVHGSEYFAPQAKIIPAWSQIIKDFVRMVNLMHQGGVIHKDFHCGNLLIAGTKLFLLDLDHVCIYRHRGEKFIRAAKDDLQHFLKFLAPNQTAQRLFHEECKELL